MDVGEKLYVHFKNDCIHFEGECWSSVESSVVIKKLNEIQICSFGSKLVDQEVEMTLSSYYKITNLGSMEQLTVATSENKRIWVTGWPYEIIVV